MLHTNTDTAAYRACLASISRAHELDPDAGGFSLIGDEPLQLRPGPTVKPGAHPFAGHDPLADVGQILHGDRAAFVSHCLRNNGLADLVVHLGDVACFAAGDFTESLPGALGAVALKPPTKGKELVTVVPEFTATKDFTGMHGGNVVLAKIHRADFAVFSLGNTGKIKNKVEVEPALAPDQFRFLGNAGFKERFLEFAHIHRDDDPPLGGE